MHVHNVTCRVYGQVRNKLMRQVNIAQCGLMEDIPGELWIGTKLQLARPETNVYVYRSHEPLLRITTRLVCITKIMVKRD